MTQKRLDPALRSASIGVLIVAAILSLVAFFAYDARTALGVAIGGGIAYVNLLVFIRIGQAFLDQRGSAAPWALITVLKLGALIGGVWLIIRSGYVSGFALAIGYGALPMGITAGTLFKKPPQDSNDDENEASGIADSSPDVLQDGPESGPGSLDEDSR